MISILDHAISTEHDLLSNFVTEIDPDGIIMLNSMKINQT